VLTTLGTGRRQFGAEFLRNKVSALCTASGVSVVNALSEWTCTFEGAPRRQILPQRSARGDRNDGTWQTVRGSPRKQRARRSPFRPGRRTSSRSSGSGRWGTRSVQSGLREDCVPDQGLRIVFYDEGGARPTSSPIHYEGAGSGTSSAHVNSRKDPVHKGDHILEGDDRSVAASRWRCNVTHPNPRSPSSRFQQKSKHRGRLVPPVRIKGRPDAGTLNSSASFFLTTPGAKCCSRETEEQPRGRTDVREGIGRVL